MGKTVDEIHKETPLSLTDTDNPIFEIDLSSRPEDNAIMVPLLHVDGETDFEVKNGDRFRLIERGCRLVKAGPKIDANGDMYYENNPSTQFRYGTNGVILIPSSILKHVYGELSE